MVNSRSYHSFVLLLIHQLRVHHWLTDLCEAVHPISFFDCLPSNDSIVKHFNLNNCKNSPSKCNFFYGSRISLLWHVFVFAKFLPLCLIIHSLQYVRFHEAFQNFFCIFCQYYLLRIARLTTFFPAEIVTNCGAKSPWSGELTVTLFKQFKIRELDWYLIFSWKPVKVW